MSALDATFGIVRWNGVELEAEGALDFISPFVVTRNAEDGSLDISFDASALDEVLAAPSDPGDDYAVPYALDGDLVYNPYFKAASGGLQINGATANGSAMTIPHGHDFLSGMLSTSGFATLFNWGGVTDALAVGTTDVASQAYTVKASTGFYQWKVGATVVGAIGADGLTVAGYLSLNGGEISHASGILSYSDGADLSYPIGPIETPNSDASTAINLTTAVLLGNRLRCTAATAVSVTIPADTSGYPVGSVVNITQVGAGQVTLVASGSTLNTPETLKTRTQYSTISIYKVSASVWDVTGDLELTP
jgi:hypothetical protein